MCVHVCVHFRNRWILTHQRKTRLIQTMRLCTTTIWLVLTLLLVLMLHILPLKTEFRDSFASQKMCSFWSPFFGASSVTRVIRRKDHAKEKREKWVSKSCGRSQWEGGSQREGIHPYERHMLRLRKIKRVSILSLCILPYVVESNCASKSHLPSPRVGWGIRIRRRAK